MFLSGQIIATSYDQKTPNGGLVREIPLFQGNLGSPGPKIVPVVGPSGRNVGGGLLAMDVCSLFEPCWDSTTLGSSVDILAECVIYDPTGNKHLLRTVLHRKFIVFEGTLPKAFAFSILRGIVTGTNNGIRIKMGTSTIVLDHCTAEMRDVTSVVELCSGIGVMSDGLISAGAQINCKNELRETFVKLQKSQGCDNIVLGDIGDYETIGKVFNICKSASMIVAGFNCQPWSKLGDGRKLADIRSSSLFHVLRYSFFSRAHSVMLECVSEAGCDVEVQKILQEFCKLTGFRMKVVNLNLEHFWPSRRARWWCMLINPAFPLDDLRPLPVQKMHPVVSSLFPQFPIWPSEEEEQLALDLYETNKFIEFNSFDKAMVKGDYPLNTALHGWGNQLQGCPCGCRQFSMNHDRLRSKGLFGALIIMEGTLESVDGPRIRSRNIHPFELSVLTGALPDKIWLPNLKLSLCGLGQMASPIQSAWMYGQYMYSIGNFFGWKDIPTPEETLWNHVKKVFDSYQTNFPLLFAHEKVEQFVSDTHDLLFCNHMDRIVPSPVLMVPENSKDHSEQGKAIEDAETTGFDQIDGPIQEDGYECVADIVNDETWVCPFQECFICDPNQIVQPLQHESVTSFALDGLSPTLPFQIDQDAMDNQREITPRCLSSVDNDGGATRPGDLCYAEKPSSALQRQSADNPIDELGIHSIGNQPYTSKGGVVAFSRKRPHVDTPDLQALQPKLKQPWNNDALKKSEHDIGPGQPEVEEKPIGRINNETGKSTEEARGDSERRCTDTFDTFTQDVKTDIWDIEKLADAGFDAKHGSMSDLSSNGENCHFVQLFLPGEPKPSFVLVPRDATMGCLQVAEDKLRSVSQPTRPNNAVGVPIPIASTTTPFQQIFLHQAADYHQPKCGESQGPSWFLQKDQVVPRIEILYRQEACVAKDEMDFYLTFIKKSIIGEIVPVLSDVCDEALVNHWWNLCVKETSKGPVASAICFHHHWIPIVISADDRELQISTTREGLCFLTDILHLDQKSIHLVTMPQVFRADCGFQALGMIIQVLTDLQSKEQDGSKRAIPVDVKTAVAWRRLFEHHLLTSGEASNPIRVGSVVLGGAKTGTPEDQLHEMLIAHGVPPDVATERRDSVINRIGRTKLIGALRSHRPWAELKASCNEISPKVQLVMPSELEVLIKNRVARSDTFGDKTRKKGRSEKVENHVSLAPSDVSIPDGIFKQGTNELVKQIPLQSIGQDASGIVVLTSHEATPYMKLSKPITKNGLALLILDHSHPSCQGLGHVLRFPCRCERSGESIIATARLIQLGCIEITRNVPETPSFVEEVPTSVIRILLYRDECNSTWSEVIQRPVKFVLQQLGLEASSSDNRIVDVWDRQFLDLKLSKVKPHVSELFMVSVRIQGDAKPLIMQSGSQGTYVEPRSHDGRSPDCGFRVIWLSKVDKATAITALQSTKGQTSLARSGIRFGLRAVSSEAESIHVQHKANIPYLDTSAALKYIAGPFPYGVTRDGLLKLFGEWGWKARPIQPRGRSGDGAGIQWEIQAECPPDSEVYSMRHGDIIISEVGKKKVAEFTQKDVLASAKTLALLRQTKPAHVGSAVVAQDPLEINDPWASWNTGVKQHRPNPTEISQLQTTQVETIPANFDRKLAETIAQVDQRIASCDVSMAGSSDSRIEQVEARLQQLETSMTQQQISHQQHQVQVSQKFQQVEHQMEAQTKAYQQHLDSKMSEQLAQIEVLLGKKARRE